MICPDKVLSSKSHNVEGRWRRASELYHLEVALASYEAALAVDPDVADILNNRAVVLWRLNRLDVALSSCNAALKANPNFAEALYNRGNIHFSLRHYDDALDSYDKALALKSNYPEALNNRGNSLRILGRFNDALASFNEAIAISPTFSEAMNNRGVAMWELNRYEEALASYSEALKIHPAYAEALNNRGNALRALRRFGEALKSFDEALEIRSDYAEAWFNRGILLWETKRLEEALASYEMAIALEPLFVEALHNRGLVLWDMKEIEESLASFDRALVVRPQHIGALNNRANALLALNRFEEALASCERVLAIDPNHLYAFGGLATAALNLCDWSRVENIAAEIKMRVNRSIISPYTVISYSDDAALQLQYARSYIANKFHERPPPLWIGTAHCRDKIRIAYMSSDFRTHPVAYQVAQLIEKHDRSKFEVLGISTGTNDGSEIRARLIGAFDRFYDLQSLTNDAAAQFLRNLEIDVIIELGGHTLGSRIEVLSHRPCPVQVSYLGYPGTIGTEFIDYIIGDRIALPFDQQPHFMEKIIHLPGSFWVSDSEQPVGKAPTRLEAGLPESGFVFCCFNRNWKFTRSVFDVWMRLLTNIPDSVLWLGESSAGVRNNLLKEALARGISWQRIIFNNRVVNRSEYLGWQSHSDLFLDTVPYNAHSTASDALWAGLPVVTCKGKSFSGRVAASLLHALAMPELITDSLVDYERVALTLAKNPDRLRNVRQKLAKNRLNSQLFDTDRFTRHIEAAFIRMLEIARAGETPSSFAITAEES